MIVVTGGAGFIGSCIVSGLNHSGFDDILVVDVLRHNDKWKNLRNLRFNDYIDRLQLDDFLNHHKNIDAIIHMGACSSTTESDAAYLMENNYRYSLMLLRHSLRLNCRFIYASSAATYGSGDQGYDDEESKITSLQPLNMYGYSKQVFDLKVLREGWSSSVAGLKFFNVYGPNEYHKGDMSSVIYKAFNQIRENGYVNLFKSHRPDYEDGQQLRDFVYVKDVVQIVLKLLEKSDINGIFNVGYGKARSFKDLATATFKAMNLPVDIRYIDMPGAIRDRYQYFTEARMDKLIQKGIVVEMTSLEKGVQDYVQGYLQEGLKYF